MAEIAKLGGSVCYDWQAAGKKEPTGAACFRKLFGDDFFSSVTDILIESDELTDDWLVHLEPLTALKHIRLDCKRSKQITDAGLNEIGALTALHHLAVASPKVTDRGVSDLGRLTNLGHLELPRQISDAAMVHLRDLTNLKTLICAAQTPPQRRIIAAMRESTDAAFTAQPLCDVIEYFQNFHEIPIDIAELLKAKLPIDVPVTAELHALPLGTAIRQILEPLGLEWTLGPNRLLITTRDAVAAARPELTKLRRTLPNLTLVVVDWDVPSLKSPDGNGPTEEERAIESLAQFATMDVDDAGSLHSISLAGAQADDAALEIVAKFRTLVALDLSGTQITSSGLRYLLGLAHLRSLDLSRTSVGDEGMAEVARLPALDDLRLDGTSVSDRGVAMIAGLGKLARLSLRRTSVTGRGLAHLKDLSALGFLSLEGVHDDALRSLEGFSRLRALHLAGPQVGDAGVACLARLDALEYLRLDHTSVTADGLRKLSSLPALESLSLIGGNFNSGSFAPLSDLAHLTQLELLNDRSISDQCVASLASLENLEFLSLDGAAITDVGLEQFPRLTALRSLNLFRTKVTPNGVATLQRRLPKLSALDAGGNRHAALDE